MTTDREVLAELLSEMQRIRNLHWTHWSREDSDRTATAIAAARARLAPPEAVRISNHGFGKGTIKECAVRQAKAMAGYWAEAHIAEGGERETADQEALRGYEYHERKLESIINFLVEVAHSKDDLTEARGNSQEAQRLADAFERSADWLDHGSLAGSARTHPLVGTADYRKACAILRGMATEARGNERKEEVKRLADTLALSATDERADGSDHEKDAAADAYIAARDRLHRAIDALAAPQADACGNDAHPRPGVFLIKFDDTEVGPEIVIGEAAARERFRRVSTNWNAHLFVKVASNTRDDPYYSDNALTPPPDWRNLLMLIRPYVEAAGQRGYDGTGGHDIRETANKRLAAIDAALAAPQINEPALPVAYVPIHPRNGPLWAMTTDTPDPQRLPSYPLMQLYADPINAPEAERARWIAICKEHAADTTPSRKPFDNYLDGWLDACNEIMWAGEADPINAPAGTPAKDEA